MALKDWKKAEDKADYISFHHKEIKDYNLGEPKHMQVGEKYRYFAKNVIRINKGWKAEDVEKRDEKKALWSVDDYTGKLNKTAKTRSQALQYAKQFMRTH